jgi:hypothetical protein
MHELYLSGRSDDIINISVYDNESMVFDDELYFDKNDERIFSISNLINVYVAFKRTIGWTIGISIVDEYYNPIELGLYKFEYVMSSSKRADAASYTPTLYLKSEIPIFIAGVFGDKESELREKFTDIVEEDKIDAVITILKNEKLI